MPTWLVHGFRWPRPLIRIHIILQNLEDATSEWLMAPATTTALTENFNTLYPDVMPKLPSMRFIEQYDPDDLTSKDQPYAYVCDQVHEVKLGVDIDDVRGKGVANDAWGALMDLRDKIAPGEKVGWFVVVNGDIERWAPPVDDPVEDSPNGSQLSPASARSSMARTTEDEEDSDQTKRPKGLKKWFGGGRMKRKKSSKSLKGDMAIRTAPPQSPPLPIPNVPHPPRKVNGIANGKGSISSNGEASAQRPETAV